LKLQSAIFTSQQLKLNPLDLADCDLVFSPVVKLGGPARLVRSHPLGMLEPASILQVDGRTGRAPGVAPQPASEIPPWIYRHQLPDNQKIIKHPDGRQFLFNRRFRAGHLLDIGRHMERPDSVQREPVFAGPVKELVTGPCASQPGVPVPDGGREEFNIGVGSTLAGGGDEIGDPGRSRAVGAITYLSFR
jgi:hypothetical protein